MYLRQIGERWYFSIYITLADGKKKKIERVGGNTPGEAKKACKQYLLKFNLSEDRLGAKKTTVESFFQEWVTDYVDVSLSVNTQATYKNFIKKHVIPSIGHMALSKVTPLVLQKMINNMKKKYSKNTLTSLVGMLKKAFKHAVILYEYLLRNPAENIMVPKYEEMIKEAHVFSEHDIAEIFAAFQPEDKIYIPIQIAYHTGMRANEILALSWNDIGFEEMEIYVHKNFYDKTQEKVIKNVTKGRRSRIISIGTELIDILKKHQIQQQKNKECFSPHYLDSDLICTDQQGVILTSNNLRWFNIWCEKNGIDGSFHTFRHTYATRMLEAGMDIDLVSKQLGHSSVYVTSKVYLHLTRVRRKLAIKMIDNANAGYVLPPLKQSIPRKRKSKSNYLNPQ